MRYIGSKRQLLSKIESVILDNQCKGNILCDIFAGTGSVGEFFKSNYQIISNDFLYFSYCIQRAKIGNNGIPKFSRFIKKYKKNPLDVLDNISTIEVDPSKLFIKNNYSDFGGRNYLSTKNAEQIDKWRISIDNWFKQGDLNEDEYYYLVACVVETVPFYSNISGTYGAFLKTWDRRALKPIKLVRLEVLSNNKENTCYNENGDELIKKIKGDILYIDPPYNERQYLPNYHLLETVAKYDYPTIKGVTGIREYKSQKSAWCNAKTALSSLDAMVKNAKFKYIILSYNTDGIMKEQDIINTMKKYSKNNECKVYRFPYIRFKSRTLVNNSKLEELMFFVEK